MIEPTRTAIDRRLPTHELNARRTRKRATKLSTAVQRRKTISPQPTPLLEHAPTTGTDRSEGRRPAT